jgi:hypothetical protein
MTASGLPTIVKSSRIAKHFTEPPARCVLQ